MNKFIRVEVVVLAHLTGPHILLKPSEEMATC